MVHFADTVLDLDIGNENECSFTHFFDQMGTKRLKSRFFEKCENSDFSYLLKGILIKELLMKLQYPHLPKTMIVSLTYISC